MAAAEPDWRVRLLDGFRLHCGVVEVKEPTGEGDLWLGPQRLHQSNALRKARDSRRGLDLQSRVIAGRPQADADNQPAAAQVVDSHETLCQVNWIVEGHQVHGAAQAQPAGLPRGESKQVQRVERGHPAERALLSPGAVESKGLGA